MHANLIFAPSIEPSLHKRVGWPLLQDAVMSDGELTAVIHGTAAREKLLGLSKPAPYRALRLGHPAAYYTHIAPIIYETLPIGLKHLLHIAALSKDHQSGCIAIKAVNHMGTTTLMGAFEIVIEHILDAKTMMGGSHRENTWSFVDDKKMTILINNAQIRAGEMPLSTTGNSRPNLHPVTAIEQIIVAHYGSAVNENAPTSQISLKAIAAHLWEGHRQVLEKLYFCVYRLHNC